MKKVILFLTIVSFFGLYGMGYNYSSVGSNVDDIDYYPPVTRSQFRKQQQEFKYMRGKFENLSKKNKQIDFLKPAQKAKSSTTNKYTYSGRSKNEYLPLLKSFHSQQVEQPLDYEIPEGWQKLVNAYNKKQPSAYLDIHPWVKKQIAQKLDRIGFTCAKYVGSTLYCEPKPSVFDVLINRPMPQYILLNVKDQNGDETIEDRLFYLQRLSNLANNGKTN